MSSGDQIRPFYSQARALFPLLPPDDLVQIDPDADGGEAWFNGIDVQGRPHFQVAKNFTLLQTSGHHESGHAFEAYVVRAGKSLDEFRTAFWAHRGFPGTWQECLATAQANTGMAQWMFLPGEMVAETFKNAVAGVRVGEKTMNWGKDVDPMAARAFFQQFNPQERVLTVTNYWNATWKPSPNYTPGRTVPIDCIVEHWTVGTAASVIQTFQSPISKLSAHYLVCRDGRVYQFVQEEDQAWHNAQPGSNARSIGIEHEHEDGQNWPAAQLQASYQLQKDICSRRGIPLVRSNCLGHCETGYATACPGDLPIDTIIGDEDLAADPQVLAKLDAVVSALNENTNKVGALANSIMTWMDREQRGADVASGGPDPNATKP